MRDEIAPLGPLERACEHCCPIPGTFAGGLFHGYDVEGLPRPTNELEQCFGLARGHERRARGRGGAIPGVVVWGSVRVMAAVGTTQQAFPAEELRPREYQRWHARRAQGQQREESRRQQWRFRQDPAAYLTALEARVLQ